MFKTKFHQDLEALVNRHAIESDSNTPDFILAKYILACLEAYSKAVNARDKFFNVKLW